MKVNYSFFKMLFAFKATYQRFFGVGRNNYKVQVEASSICVPYHKANDVEPDRPMNPRSSTWINAVLDMLYRYRVLDLTNSNELITLQTHSLRSQAESFRDVIRYTFACCSSNLCYTHVLSPSNVFY